MTTQIENLRKFVEAYATQQTEGADALIQDVITKKAQQLLAVSESSEASDNDDDNDDDNGDEKVEDPAAE